jgi:hypothetical protein
MSRATSVAPRRCCGDAASLMALLCRPRPMPSEPSPQNIFNTPKF